jgi:T5SS/PEP-CTERM-associated repeat protein
MIVRPLRPSGPLTILTLCVILLAGVLAPSARGQSTSSALWTAGAGAWSNQNNWDCSGPPFPPGNAGPCVPNGANYGVSIPASSQVSLDIGATVNSINMGGATLTISGTSLTAPLIFGGTLILSSHGRDQGGFSGDSLSLDQGSQMNGGSGAIGVSGSVTLSNGSQITGTTVSGSSVTLSGGSSIDSTNGFTGGSGTLSGSSQWNGLSGASGTFTMSQNSSVTGFGDFQGTLNISGGSTITVTDNGANFGVAGMQLHGSNVIDGSSVEYGTLASRGIITVFGSLTLQNSASVGALNPAQLPEVDVNGATGASLTVTGNSALIASRAIIGESGSATISGGSQWFLNGGSLTVGNGALQVSGESTVTDSSATVGYFGNGKVLVSDGSNWNSGALIVGEGGSGILTINVAIVTSDSLVVAALGGTGNVTVVGGTLIVNGLESGEALTVGDAGRGSLMIGNGSFLGDSRVISNNATIANAEGSAGVVHVIGDGSLWEIHGNLIVGNAKTGSSGGVLFMEGGGNVATDGGVTIGNLPGSIGSATVEDFPSGWGIGGPLVVGNQGAGTLTVTNGAEVSGTSAVIAALPGSQGTVVVNGKGSEWNNTGQIDVGLGGPGLLKVNNLGTVTASTINVDSHGTVDGANGIFKPDTGTTLVINVLPGGTFTGDPGPITVIGNINFQMGSMLDLEIAGTGAGQFDQLNITGNGLFHGTIDLDFINGFTPVTGETFDLINVSGLANFSGDTVNVLGLPPGFNFTESFANGEFVLTTEGGTTPTPEPGTWALLAMGIAAMLLLRRRAGKRIVPLN